MTVSDETTKLRPYIAQYCSGRGVDLGCGCAKIVPEAIGVEFTFYNEPQQALLYTGENYFGHDLNWGLPMFQDNELDYVYSSHVLEDFEDPEVKLTEWTRVVKPGGLLILVLPHGDFYPKAGTPEANGSHKMDWWEDTLTDMAERLKLPINVEVVIRPEYFRKHGTDTWSFVVIFRKVNDVL
jgi:SAM-dependent methyltransferase